MKNLILIICLGVFLGGCSESSPGFRVIGPYVTNITYDRKGDLLITKEKITLFAPEHIFTKTTSVSVLETPDK
jgi:hypothetical protein